MLFLSRIIHFENGVPLHGTSILVKHSVVQEPWIWQRPWQCVSQTKRPIVCVCTARRAEQYGVPTPGPVNPAHRTAPVYSPEGIVRYYKLSVITDTISWSYNKSASFKYHTQRRPVTTHLLNVVELISLSFGCHGVEHTHGCIPQPIHGSKGPLARLRGHTPCLP